MIRKAFIISFISLYLFQSTNTQFTDDCGVNFNCYMHPSPCQNRDCKFILKWKSENQETTRFVLIANIVGFSVFDSYAAVGFSYDQLMGNDSVSMCRFSHSTVQYNVETYFNREGKFSDVLLFLNRSVGIVDFVVSLDQSLLICDFIRQNRLPNLPNFFDLGARPYYILLASGKTNSLGSPIYHFKNAVASKTMIDLKASITSTTTTTTPAYQVITIIQEKTDERIDRVKAHGSLMVIAWVLFASNGIIFARYFKFILPNQNICLSNFWLVVHRSFMILTFLISFASFIVILSYVDWKWVDKSKPVAFTHSVFGILAISLSLVQILIGALSPLAGDPRKRFVDYVHKVLGLVVYILAIVALFLGVVLPQANLGRVGWGIMVGWALWCIILPLLVEIAYQLLIYDEKGITYKLKNEAAQQSRISTSKRALINKYKKWYENIKKAFLVLHALISLTCTIALVVVIGIAREGRFI